MEIVFEKVSSHDLHNLSFSIKEGSIVGITGKGKTEFLKMIDYLMPINGEAILGNLTYNHNNIYEIRKQISFIEQNFSINNQLFLSSVEEYITFFIRYYRIPMENEKKRILSALKMVGLTEECLEKKLAILSTSEKKLLQIAISLLSNPTILLLDEPFVNLDEKTQKKLERLLLKLKERYHKTVIIASSDSNMLYNFTEYMIFLKNGTILKKGETTNLYQNVKFLMRYHYEVPDIVLFTYKAIEEKKAKIEYHKDIRDLIKDVYKHV